MWLIVKEQLARDFSERVHLFFKDRNLLLNQEDQPFVQFLFQQFENQRGFDTPTGIFHITPNFIIQATAKYLDLSPKEVRQLFQKERSRRDSVPYSTNENRDPLFKSSLIQLLGRKHRPRYKITTPDAVPLTPDSKRTVSQQVGQFDVSFSPMKPEPDPHSARDRASSAQGIQYECHMKSPRFALWVWNTPKKKQPRYSPYRRPASARKSNRYQLFRHRVETFEFSVTLDDLKKRLGVKRPISQKRVMGNVSAQEALEALGAILTDKQHNHKYHWAHRQAWSFNGAQSQENLDATSAGSNYDTLFKVEEPIRHLLIEDGFSAIQVKGRVELDDKGVASKIEYQLFYGTSGFMQVYIDPLSHRVPTVDEHEMAKTFYKISND